jgi:hypothetical protein
MAKRVKSKSEHVGEIACKNKLLLKAIFSQKKKEYICININKNESA